MPSLTTWAPFCAVVLPMWTMLSPWSKQSHGCSCQGCKATNHTGTLRNLPNPASGTYTNTRRNFPEPSGTFRNQPFGTFRNLPPEPTPSYNGTLRNLPELASGTYTILHRNSPEPSGTCLRNLHHFTPELSGTFRNPPPEPTPAHAGTLRNLPEPAPATRTGTHRSLSGLKTPLAYAVGEKLEKVTKNGDQKWWPKMVTIFDHGVVQQMPPRWSETTISRGKKLTLGGMCTMEWRQNCSMLKWDMMFPSYFRLARNLDANLRTVCIRW